MFGSRFLCIVVLLVMGAGLCWAQISFDAPTKQMIIKAGVDGAVKALAEGKPNEARLNLLAVSELYSREQRNTPPAVQQQFDQVMNQAWPTPVTNANAEQVVADWKAAIAKYQGPLTAFAMDMDFFQPHNNKSFEQWAEYVLNARATQQQAEALATEYAAAAPNVAVHLSPAGTQLGAFNILHLIYVIAVAEPLAEEYAQKDVLPRSLQKAEEALAQIPADATKPIQILMPASSASRLAGYALTVDPQNAKAKELAAKAEAADKRAQELYDAQVAENRMPADSYKGSDGEALKAEMAKAFKQAWPNCEIFKVSITSGNWVERAEAWWQGDVLKSGVFRFIEGAVAGQEKDGKPRVYFVTFAREWTGIGDEFGDLYLARNRYSYQILPENL